MPTRPSVATYLKTFHANEAGSLFKRITLTLQVLAKKGRDRPAIEGALEDAIDVRVRAQQTLRIQADLRRALARLKTTSRHLSALASMDLGAYGDERLDGIRSVASETADGYARRPQIVEEHRLPLRRQTRGQPQEHIAVLRRRLKALRVPAADVTELLQALRLIPETERKTRPRKHSILRAKE